MKIVRKSNYDSTLVDDLLIIDKELLTKKEYSAVVDRLNEICDSKYYYIVVDDTYKLYKFEP